MDKSVVIYFTPEVLESKVTDDMRSRFYYEGRVTDCNGQKAPAQNGGGTLSGCHCRWMTKPLCDVGP